MFQTLKLLAFMEGLLLLAIMLFVFSLKGAQRGIVKPGHIAAIMAIPPVGLFAGRVELFYLFAFALPLFASGDARRLACLFALMLPMFPDLPSPLMAGPFYLIDFSASRAFCAGGLVALLLAARKQKEGVAAIDGALLIVFLLMIVAAARGSDLRVATTHTIIQILAVLPGFYIIVRGIRSEQAGGDVGLFLILGGLCNAVVAIFESRRSWPLFEAFYGTLGVPMTLSASLSIRAGFLRAQGLISNPTVLSFLLALAFIACVSLRHRFSRAGLSLVLLTLAAGMIASQSRGGMIAAVVGVLLLCLYERRTAALAALGSAAAVVGLTILTVPADSRIGQVMGRSGDAQWTADYRSDLLAAGMREIRRSPVLGQTTAALEVNLDDMRQGEGIIDYVNTHLYVALKTGLVGLIFWVIAWLTVAVALWRRRPASAPVAGKLTPGLGFGLVGACLVALTFTSVVDRMLPLTAISLGLASALVQLSRQRPAPEQRRGATTEGLLASTRPTAPARAAAA